MGNVLETKVGLEFDGAKAAEAENNFVRLIQRAEEFDKALDGLGDIDKFVNNLNKGLTQAEKIAQDSIKKINSIANFNPKTNTFDVLSREALKLKQPLTILNQELDEIRRDLTRTTDPVLFKQLQKSAAEVSSEIDRLSKRVDTLGSRQSTRQRDGLLSGIGARPLQGFGGIVRQIAPAGINETEINAALHGLSQAEDVIADLGVTIPSMAAVMPLVIAGGVAIALTAKITGDIRKDSEKRLELENKISAKINEQALKYKDFKDSAEKAEKAIRASFEIEQFNKSLPSQNLSVDELKKQRDELTLLRDQAARHQSTGADLSNKLGFTGDFEQQITIADSKIAQLDKLILEAPQRQTAELVNNLDQYWKVWKQGQEATRKAEEEHFERLKKAATEIRQEAQSFLTENLAKDNPLAKLMIDFDTATEKAHRTFGRFGNDFANRMAEISRTNITEEINKQLLTMEQKALNIAQEIRRLQGGDSRLPTKDDLVSQFNRELAEFRRTSNSTNPDAFREFQRRRNEIDNFDKVKAEQDLNQRRRDIEEQVALINRSNVTTVEKHSQIANVTAGLSAEELGNSLKQIRIDALKGEFQDTLDQRKQAVEINNKLKTFLETFDKILSEQGVKIDFGDKPIMDLTVQGKNLSVSEKKKQLKEASPSQSDTVKTYNLDIVRGSNL